MSTTHHDFVIKHGLSLADDTKIKLGNAGNDLEIYHDPENSFILHNTASGYMAIKTQVNSGSLFLHGDNVHLRTYQDNEPMLTAVRNGAVTLYFNNVQKLATQSYGALVSGVLLANDGSAAAPTFSFSNDSDIGIYRATTNALGFSTGGSERMRINSSGNVQLLGSMIIHDTGGTRGIFRNDDAYDLRLGGGTEYSDGAYISLGGENRGGGTSIYKGRAEIFAGGNSFANQAAITGDVVLGARWNGGSDEILTLDSSTGRVGIQTGSPAEMLHVEGNVRLSGSIVDSFGEQLNFQLNDLIQYSKHIRAEYGLWARSATARAMGIDGSNGYM